MGERVSEQPRFVHPGYLRWWPALPVLDLRVLGVGGRAGDLWPRPGLQPGGFPHRVVLGAVELRALSEE